MSTTITELRLSLFRLIGTSIHTIVHFTMEFNGKLSRQSIFMYSCGHMILTHSRSPHTGVGSFLVDRFACGRVGVGRWGTTVGRLGDRREGWQSRGRWTEDWGSERKCSNFSIIMNSKWDKVSNNVIGIKGHTALEY